MDRLTSQEVGGLMEAYQSIYTPQQEIFEEDEEFEIDEAAVDWDTGRTASGRSPRDNSAIRQAQFTQSPNVQNQIRGAQISSVRANMRSAIKQTKPNKLQTAGPIASERFKNAAIRQRGGSPDSVPIRTVPGLKDVNKAAQARRPRGGSSSLPNVGRGVQQTPSGSGSYTPGAGGRFGISGIGLADDFNIWINDLLDEGYDLSEYTWEDMHEYYLNEYAAGGVPRSGGAVTMYSRPVANTGSSYQSKYARPMNAGTTQTYGGRRVPVRTIRPQIGSLPPDARQVTQYPQGVSTGVGGGNAATSRQAPTRPSAAPTRPSAAPIRPSAAPIRPATPTSGKPVSTARPPIAPPPPPSTTSSIAPPPPPTARPESEIGAMIRRSQENQAADAAKLAAKPAPRVSTGGARSRAQVIGASFDPFDVIKAHLLDEGYADTEESAEAIIASMSEDWINYILDESQGDKSRNLSKLPIRVGKQRILSDKDITGWETDQERTDKEERRKKRGNMPKFEVR